VDKQEIKKRERGATPAHASFMVTCHPCPTDVQNLTTLGSAVPEKH